MRFGSVGRPMPVVVSHMADGTDTLGIIDDDVVDASNLQRQVLHNMERLGMPKVESARKTLQALNPDVKVIKFEERLTSENVDRRFSGV